MAIDAVLCDLGNVAVFFDNEKTVRAFAGISGKSEDAVRDIVFRSGVGLFHRYESGDVSSEEFRRSICARLGLTKREIPRNETLFEAWTDVFTPNEPVFARLRTLWSRGAVITAVSNIDEMRHQKLERLGHLAVFDYVVMSWIEQIRKPSEELMVRALDRSGAQAERTIFIDDLAENLAPAAKLGIRTHQYVTIKALDMFLASCA